MMNDTTNIDCCAVGVLQDDLNFKSCVIYKNNIAGIKFIINGEFDINTYHKMKNKVKSFDDIIDFNLNLTKKDIFIYWDISKPISIGEFVATMNEMGIKLVADNSEYSTILYTKTLYLKQLGISFFGMMNVFIISIATWIGQEQEMSDEFLEILHISNALIAIPLIIISSRSFVINSINAIKQKKINIDVSILISIIFTTILSLYNSFQNNEFSQTNIYFESVLMLIFILTLGKYLEISTIIKNKTDLKQLFNDHNKIVVKIENGKKSTVHHDDLKNGDIIEINPNEMVGFDGIVMCEKCIINNSFITGEINVTEINKNETINKGAINLEQKIIIKIINLNNTIFDKINDIINNSKNFKNKYVLLSDKISKFYTYVIVLSSVFGYIFWTLDGKSSYDALIIAITILIISCPCAISLAIPMVHMNAILNLKQQNIIIKKGEVFEIFTKIKNVIFDKTGILTQIEVEENQLNEINKNDLIALYSLSKASMHPYANAIVNKILSNNNNIKQLNFDDVKLMDGNGIYAKINENRYILGNKIAVDINENSKNNVIYFKTNDKIYKIKFIETLMKNTQFVFDYFKKQNIRTHIISGDNKPSVTNISSQLNLQNFNFEMNPIEKQKYIKNLNDTCMIGDGINDTACLKHANISISPGNSFDLNIINSDVIYKNNDLLSVVKIHMLSKFSNNVSLQNLIFSLMYNLITIPIAFFGHLTPLYAALLMSASSVIVVLNSIRARYKKWTY